MQITLLDNTISNTITVKQKFLNLISEDNIKHIVIINGSESINTYFITNKSNLYINSSKPLVLNVQI